MKIDDAKTILNGREDEATLNGLCQMLAEEEIKIRLDPAARVTDLLKNVFGNK